MAGEDYDIRAVLSAVDNGFTAGLDAAAAKAKSFADGSKLSMESIGTGMTVAGAAVTAMGVKSITSFGQFESSLNKAAVVAGGTAKDIGQLDDLANKMGADLPLSAQDCADAMIEMARNGAGIKDIKEQFPAIAQAATAAGADIKATAGTVQESMNIWGNSLKSPQQAAAILVQTANASNASIEDMGQALATIGGTATNANMSMQVMSEAIGLLTNRGFSAAQASIDLNHAIIQMVSPSKAAKNAMTELGISFVDSQGKMKQFPLILQELNKAMANLKPNEKAQKLKAMFGTAGMQAILPLLDSVKNKSNDAKVSWDAYAKEQEKAAGSTKKATATLKEQSAEMQKNVGSSIEQLGGNWESLRNKSMKAAQDINGAAIQNTNRMLQWATDSNSATAQFIRSFIGLSPAIGTATTSVGMFLRNAKTIVGTIGGAIGGVSNFIKTAKLVASVVEGWDGAKAALIAFSNQSKIAAVAVKILNSAFLTSPITWIVAGITAVVAGLTWFFTQTKTGRAMWASFVSWLKGLWQGIVIVARTIWNSLVTVFKTVYNLSMAVWRPIVSFFRVLWQGIVIVTRTVWNVMRAYISTVFKNIQTVIRTDMTIIRTIFSAGWRILTTVVSTVWKMITTIVSGSINAVAGIIRAITAAIRGDWSGAWNAIKGVVQTVWDTIKSVVQTGLSAVQSIVTTVMNAVKGVFSSMWNAIKSIFSNAAKGITDIMKSINLFSIGQNIVKGLINGLKSMIGSIGNVIGNIKDSIVGGLKGLLGIHSPSTVMRDEIGQYITLGIVQGILSKSNAVTDAMGKIANLTQIDFPKVKVPDINLPKLNSHDFEESIRNLNSNIQNNINGNIKIDNSNAMARTNQLLERIANKDNTMVLDTGKVVAETTGQYNDSLGEQVARRDRWS